MSSVRKSLLWSLSERYVGFAISFGSTIVLSRLLTPREIGVFSLCAAFTAIAGILRDFGVSEFLIQEKHLTPGKIRGAFAVAMVVAWVIAILLFITKGFVALYYQEEGISDVLAVLCLNFFLLPFASPAYALLNREMAFNKIFVIQIVSNATLALTSIVLAVTGHSYMSLAWASVASTLIQIILITYYRPHDSLLLPSFREAKVVWSYGMLFAGTRLIETLTRNMHEFIIGRQFGFEALGLFSRAYGLVEQFYNTITSAILRVATPAFASDHRNGHSHQSSYAQGITLFTGISWPFFTLVAIFAQDIIEVLFGHQWIAAAPLATILSASAVLSSLLALAPNLLTATGNIKRRLQVSMIAGPSHIIIVFLASWISLEAMATAWAINWMLILFLYSYHVDKVIAFSLIDTLRASTKSMFITVVILPAQAAIAIISHKQNFPLFSILLLAVTVTAIIWVITVFAFKHPLRNEIIRVWSYLHQHYFTQK